jgi:hypothetical protein
LNIKEERTPGREDEIVKGEVEGEKKEMKGKLEYKDEEKETREDVEGKVWEVEDKRKKRRK